MAKDPHLKILRNYAGLSKLPSIDKIIKIDSTIRHIYGSDYKAALSGKGMYDAAWLKREIIRQASGNLRDAKKAKARGELSGDKAFKEARSKRVDKEAIRSAKKYIQVHGNLKKGSAEARASLDDGDSSHGELWRQHTKALKEAKQTLGQKSDAQSKTAKVSKGGSRSIGGKSISKIAQSMKDSGKSGWVTIGGAKINLG